MNYRLQHVSTHNIRHHYPTNKSIGLPHHHLVSNPSKDATLSPISLDSPIELSRAVAVPKGPPGQLLFLKSTEWPLAAHG
jgi:hypothetical protein